MRPEDKQKVLVEVRSRVKERVLSSAKTSREAYLENLIHEVLYCEDERLRHDTHAVRRKEDREWLKSLRRRFQGAGETEKKKILEEIIDRHTSEVAGHFSEPVYKFSTSVIPVGLSLLLNAFSPLKLIRTLPRLPDLNDNVIIQGETKQALELKKRGTLVLAPTHSSNLDSILMGYSIFAIGLPPVTYGAGLNLFEDTFLGFFMNRLGAYKVDRLKKHSLYKEVLKEYAVVTLEHGYDNLFFPGGTRCRSGAVERKIKLGLLGGAVRAYFNNLTLGRPKPKIFVIPVTINYQLVLEAENLIEDHLKEAGKSRYIIVDDEFSMPSRIFAFLHNLITLDQKIYLTFSRALDPFGNAVDDSGESVDGQGRPIDIERYFLRKGVLHEDAARDAEFTRQLGDRVMESFARDTVVFSSHVLAWTVFERLRESHPDPDFYRFLRTGSYDLSMPMADAYREAERTLAAVRKLADRGGVRLSATLASGNVESLVDEALKLFGCYHTRPVLERRGDRIFPVDMNLLYYYRNRLWGYGLERSL